MPISLNCTDEDYATGKLCSGVLYAEHQTFDAVDDIALTGYMVPDDTSVYFRTKITVKRISGTSPQAATYTAIMDSVYRAEFSTVNRMGDDAVTVIQQDDVFIASGITAYTKNDGSLIDFHVKGISSMDLQWNLYVEYYTVLGNSA